MQDPSVLFGQVVKDMVASELKEAIRPEALKGDGISDLDVGLSPEEEDSSVGPKITSLLEPLKGNGQSPSEGSGDAKLEKGE